MKFVRFLTIMSATINVIITCDGGHPECEGNDWSADASPDNAKRQRCYAKNELGWIQVGSKDYCPACNALRKKARTIDRIRGHMASWGCDVSHLSDEEIEERSKMVSAAAANLGLSVEEAGERLTSISRIFNPENVLRSGVIGQHH